MTKKFFYSGFAFYDLFLGEIYFKKINNTDKNKFSLVLVEKSGSRHV